MKSTTTAYTQERDSQLRGQGLGKRPASALEDMSSCQPRKRQATQSKQAICSEVHGQPPKEEQHHQPESQKLARNRQERNENSSNPHRCSVREHSYLLDKHYSTDVHHYLIECEERWVQQRKRDKSLEPASEISQHMRAILVDWLIEVADEFKFQAQTLFLAINYLDRFLEIKSVVKSHLQLVGITCMFIACKYEEIRVPLIEEFVNITNHTYTREEILRKETVILNTLEFQLTTVTIHNFLGRFSICAGITGHPVITHFSNYLAEMVLPIYPIHNRYRPSLLAAAVVYLTRYAFGLSSSFDAYSGYTHKDLAPCVRDIFSAYTSIQSTVPGGKYTAARDKYKQAEYSSVSLFILKCPVL